MAFNINEFKSQGLIGGGARPSLFDVSLTLPDAVHRSGDARDKIVFTCRATSIPIATLEAVDVPYFGRKIKLAGDRTFPDWSVTIMNDEDYIVRNAMEEWSASMNSVVTNLRKIDDTGYKTDAIVTSYGKAGNMINIYKFIGIFPTSVDAMDMDWDSTNAIQTFGVNFAYDYWTNQSSTDNQE